MSLTTQKRKSASAISSFFYTLSNRNFNTGPFSKPKSHFAWCLILQIRNHIPFSCVHGYEYVASSCFKKRIGSPFFLLSSVIFHFFCYANNRRLPSPILGFQSSAFDVAKGAVISKRAFDVACQYSRPRISYDHPYLDDIFRFIFMPLRNLLLNYWIIT